MSSGVPVTYSMCSVCEHGGAFLEAPSNMVTGNCGGKPLNWRSLTPTMATVRGYKLLCWDGRWLLLELIGWEKFAIETWDQQEPYPTRITEEKKGKRREGANFPTIVFLCIVIIRNYYILWNTVKINHEGRSIVLRGRIFLVVVVAELGLGPVGMFGNVWSVVIVVTTTTAESSTTRFLFCECPYTLPYNVCLRQVIHLCLLACPLVRSLSSSPLAHSRPVLSPQFGFPCLASATFLSFACPLPFLLLLCPPPFFFYSLLRPLLTIIPPPTWTFSSALLSSSSFNCPHPSGFISRSRCGHVFYFLIELSLLLTISHIPGRIVYCFLL